LHEACRTAVDALPLLQKAEQVVVVEMALDPDFADVYKRLNDVLVWLQRHGVTAEPRVLLSTGDDAGSLDVVAHERDAGAIVAGTYGHSRLREWALGGMTCKLLRHVNRYLLVSH